MKLRLNHTTLLFSASLLALWPVIDWYTKRLLDGSDEKFGVLALITAIGYLLTQRANHRQPQIPLLTLSLLMLVYLCSYVFLPPILRAAIAITLLGVLCSHYFLGRGLTPALWGLLLLSLPLMASLQFFLGYPLRWLVGDVAVHLLQLNGLAVTHTGTLLNWDGGSVSIDAPCSGIKMMWFGFYLCLTLACVYRMRLARLLALSLMTLGIIIAANILRATALFYIESGLIPMPAWAHDGVGMVTFIAAAIVILWLADRLAPRSLPCPA
jgi:exosortase/archaeosortase family protein